MPKWLACLAGSSVMLGGCQLFQPARSEFAPRTPAVTRSAKEAISATSAHNKPTEPTGGTEQPEPTARITGLRPASPQPPAHDPPADALQTVAFYKSTDADALMLAAERLEADDFHGAIRHLQAHIRANPRHVLLRSYLADLLFQTKDWEGARIQYEATIPDAQAGSPSARQNLTHCHTRLMEIHQHQENKYGEHLHRGIGLYLLASRAKETEATMQEPLLMRAKAELELAHKAAPEKARPLWYLHQCWRQLDQPIPAQKNLRLAKARCQKELYTDLTPAEMQSLTLASWDWN